MKETLHLPGILGKPYRYISLQIKGDFFVLINHSQTIFIYNQELLKMLKLSWKKSGHLLNLHGKAVRVGSSSRVTLTISTILSNMTHHNINFHPLLYCRHCTYYWASRQHTIYVFIKCYIKHKYIYIYVCVCINECAKIVCF